MLLHPRCPVADQPVSSLFCAGSLEKFYKDNILSTVGNAVEFIVDDISHYPFAGRGPFHTINRCT